MFVVIFLATFFLLYLPLTILVWGAALFLYPIALYHERMYPKAWNGIDLGTARLREMLSLPTRVCRRFLDRVEKW